MKKTVLILLGCCLLLCVSCVEKDKGVARFDLSDAKNLYLGSAGASKGIGTDFAEVTKDNNTKNVTFNFPVDTRLSGYSALPDRIYQLNEDYILVKFGLPLILVRTSDGFGRCLNHIDSKQHFDMSHVSDEFAFKRQFKINASGDVYYLGRYLSKKIENRNDMTGFKIMKFCNSENRIETFFTYDTGKMRGGNYHDSILVDINENTAASSIDQTDNSTLIVALPRYGTPIVKEYSVKFNGSFIGPDGVFYFVSDKGYVSIVFDSANKIAEMSDMKNYPEGFCYSDEYVVLNGKVYGFGPWRNPISFTASEGVINDVQIIDTGVNSINDWDYAGDYIFISGDNRVMQIDTTDNSVTEVVSEKRIKSFTASEEHGITLETDENGSYALWVQDLLSTAMTKIQESTEAFEDLVKVE